MAKKDEELEKIDREIPSHLKLERPQGTEKENDSSGNRRLENQSSMAKTQQEIATNSKIIAGQLTKAKNQANDKFKEGEFKAAIDSYTKIVKDIENRMLLEDKSDSEFGSIKDIYLTSLSNCVQSYINIMDYDMAILLGKKVLSIDQGHVKSYFRTGKAMK